MKPVPVTEEAIAGVLAAAHFMGAARTPLAQDASTRSYERLELGPRTAMLMKAHPGSEPDGPCHPAASERERLERGWNWTSRLAASRVEAFAAVSAYLRGLGFSAPDVLAVNSAEGVAVVEDLGAGVFATVLAAGDADEAALYTLAGELLAVLHGAPVPQSLPAPDGSWPILDLDWLALRVNSDLFVEWVPKFLGQSDFDPGQVQAYRDILDTVIDQVMALPRALTLRDYHAENLIWLPQRAGVGQIGLLDFQDAVHGYRAWDFTMLLHDARRDVSPQAHAAALAGYCRATGVDVATLERELALTGAINVLRIIGIFARLVYRDHREKYRQFMPRMVGHLRSVLAEPSLAPLKEWIDANAPLDALVEVAHG